MRYDRWGWEEEDFPPRWRWHGYTITRERGMYWLVGPSFGPNRFRTKKAARDHAILLARSARAPRAVDNHHEDEKGIEFDFSPPARAERRMRAEATAPVFREPFNLLAGRHVTEAIETIGKAIGDPASIDIDTEIELRLMADRLNEFLKARE